MFDISGSELLIVLVIVVLLFGPGRLARTMGEIGKGLRSFKESLSPAEKRPCFEHKRQKSRLFIASYFRSATFRSVTSSGPEIRRRCCQHQCA